MTTEEFIEFVQERLVAHRATLMPVPDAQKTTEIVETYSERPGLRVRVFDGTEFLLSAAKT